MDIDKRLPQSLVITRLQPSHLVSNELGDIVFNSPTPALVVVMKHMCVILPGNIELPTQTVVLIPAAYPCKFRSDSTNPVELTAVDFSFTYNGLDTSLAFPKKPLIVSDQHAGQLADIICNVCNTAYLEAGICQTARSMVAGYQIAESVSDLLGLDSNTTIVQHRDPEVSRLVAYLQENYHLPLMVEDIAADCGISRRQVFKVAAKLDNMTPMRLLKKIRLEKSLDLLQREAIGINEAAEKVGFVNSKNFSREFRRYYGLLPRQYRQRSTVGAKVASLIKKADINLERNVPKRASILYLKAIESAHPWTNVDELHYKAGLALRRAGNLNAAEESWKKLTGLYYHLRVNLERCEGHNKGANYHEVIELLRECYTYADDELRVDVAERLGNWMLQCAMTDKVIAAKEYSKFAKELVRDHPGLEAKLAKSLYSTGQFAEIETYCPRQDFYVAAALRVAGRFQEHLERFPHMRHQCAVVTLRMERYDEVLDEFSDIPDLCCEALLRAGRAEEAVERFPDLCAKALLSLERYQQVLDDHANDDEACMWALTQLGRHDEAMALAQTRPVLVANLLIHHEKALKVTSSSEFYDYLHNAANLLNGIHLLKKHRFEEAMEVFESVISVTSPKFFFGHGFFSADILIPFIRRIHPEAAATVHDTQWPPLETHFRNILKNFRFIYEQQQWYAIRFILGQIDEAEFLSQPDRFAACMELGWIKGIKAELRGDSHAAVASYQEYFETGNDPQGIRYYRQWFWPINKAFVRWRLSELESGGRS